MSMFNVPVKVVGGAKAGLPTSLEAGNGMLQQIVYRKPILSFDWNTTREATPEETEELGVMEMPVTLKFAFQVDPKLLQPEHNNRITAIREQMNAATRQVERMNRTAMEAQGYAEAEQMRYEDLPNREILEMLNADFAEAMDERLCDTVMRDPSTGQTMWNWFAEDNSPVILSPEYLRANVKLGEAMHAAWNEWYFPTRRQSEAIGKAKTVNSTSERTNKTQKASSSDSVTRYGVPAKNAQATASDSSPGSTSQSNSQKNGATQEASA
jgi:hypothetical protein